MMFGISKSGRSAVDVSTSIIINRPKAEVAAYAANPDNVPAWYVNIRSVEWKTSRPLVLGTLLAFKANFLGRELSYIYEIVEYIPGQKLRMQTTDGPFEMETTYVWETIDAATSRMTLRNRGNPSGFSRIAAPFMGFMMKRENNKDLARIKAVMEETAI